MSHSFRPTKQDNDAIAKIQLDRGGISVSDAIRVALHECASGKPRLAIVPAMAPPKDFSAFKKTLESFSEDLVYVAETGLPHVTPETHVEDIPAIESARAKFHTTCGHIDDIVLKVELFSRLIAALASCDITALRKAVGHQQRLHDAQTKWALDPNIEPKERAIAQTWARESAGPILALLSACGITASKLKG